MLLSRKALLQPWFVVLWWVHHKSKHFILKTHLDEYKGNCELQKVLLLLLLPAGWSASDPVFFTVVSPIVKVIKTLP